MLLLSKVAAVMSELRVSTIPTSLPFHHRISSIAPQMAAFVESLRMSMERTAFIAVNAAMAAPIGVAINDFSGHLEGCCARTTTETHKR